MGTRGWRKARVLVLGSDLFNLVSSGLERSSKRCGFLVAAEGEMHVNCRDSHV